MSQANSPEYRRGREHHEARNEARASCPPADLWTYHPQDVRYTVMYDAGWNSVADVPVHSCKTCREGGAGL